MSTAPRPIRWQYLWPLGLLLLLALLPVIPVGYTAGEDGGHWLSLDGWLSSVFGRNVRSDLANLMIFAVLALGLNVVVGYTGLLNLGIAAFFGIGAYVTGVLMTTSYPFQLGFAPTIVIATLVAMLAGVMLGAPTLRLRGDYLALVTLGFGEVVRFSLRNMEEFVGGTKGLSVPPLIDVGDWSSDVRCYYLCFGVLAAVLFVLRNLERSHVGRSWMAIREDELAATCMGLNPTKIKLSAFALGAGLAGLAGCLYATKLSSTAQPDSYDFARSITILCCIILGGMGSLRGTVIGVFLLLGFDNVLAPLFDDKVQSWLAGDGGATASPLLTFKNWRYLIFGLALILMMRYRPEGLFPSRRVAEELHELHDSTVE